MRSWMLKLPYQLVPTLAIGVVMFPGLARAEAYPAQVVTQFLTSCQENFQTQIPALAPKGLVYCQCVIQELQNRLSYAEFTQLAGTLSPTDPAAVNQEVLTSTAQTCMAQTLQ